MSTVPLNDEQKLIMQNKAVALHRPIDELIALLLPIARADAAGDSLRTMLGCMTPVALVAGVVVAFMNVIPFHHFLAPLFLVGGVASWLLYRGRKKSDLSDNLRKCAVPLLLALRDDFSPTDPVELKLDLRPPDAPEKKTGSEKVGGKTLTTFHDPWMSCQGILADGSRVRWSVDETILQSRYWKKGSSGKSKLKTKTKKKADIDVELTLRTKTYEVSDAAAGEKKSTLTASSKIKQASGDPLSPRAIVDVIAGLYAQVAPAK